MARGRLLQAPARLRAPRGQALVYTQSRASIGTSLSSAFPRVTKMRDPGASVPATSPCPAGAQGEFLPGWVVMCSTALHPLYAYVWDERIPFGLPVKGSVCPESQK